MAMARRGTFSVSLAKKNIYTCSALFSGPNAPSSVAIDYSPAEAMKTLFLLLLVSSVSFTNLNLIFSCKVHNC